MRPQQYFFTHMAIDDKVAIADSGSGDKVAIGRGLSGDPQLWPGRASIHVFLVFGGVFVAHGTQQWCRCTTSEYVAHESYTAHTTAHTHTTAHKTTSHSV
jgi:hypothetical protein